MTIPEAREKCKSLLARVPRDAAIVAVIVLASSASFGLGFLAGRDAGQGSGGAITIEETNAAASSTVELPTSSTRSNNSGQAGSSQAGRVVASKNGTKYYPPNCAGASRISDTNKVWFVSAAAAREAGYEPAANCAGL